MPLSFHILTGKSDSLSGQVRGPRINGFLSIIRGCQDVMGTFIFGGVFDRFPDLKVVCVEADAGWVPHYMYRICRTRQRSPRPCRIQLNHNPRRRGFRASSHP